MQTIIARSLLNLKKNTLNPIATHHLENLTNDDNLERSEPNALEYMAKSIESGRKLAEYHSLERAIKAVDAGKTYAQWMYEDETSVNDSFLKEVKFIAIITSSRPRLDF